MKSYLYVLSLLVVALLSLSVMHRSYGLEQADTAEAGNTVLDSGVTDDRGKADNRGRQVFVLSLDGAIGPASRDYVIDGLKRAQEQGAVLLVMELDTPGGLDRSMRDIIKAIIASNVPIATYVSPSGARAASAGTYMLYASHIAAMMPGTNLGAATPVQMGGMPSIPNSNRRDFDKEPTPAPRVDQHLVTSAVPVNDYELAIKGNNGGGDQVDSNAEAMRKKITNDAAAYIRGLAELRGRNKEWAELAVREAASLSAEEALKIDVIDIVATDLSDLLSQIDGRTVNVNGSDQKLDVNAAFITRHQPDWRTKFLSVITDPNIAYLLMLMGMYGLIYEFLNPGFLLPGVVGTICLVLAMYALQVLPLNYAGLTLIILGVGFMIAEAFIPSFGVLGVGGIIAFTVGSIILFNDENYSVSLGVIIGNALIASLLLSWVLGMLIKLRKKPAMAEVSTMVGMSCIAQEDFEGEGLVYVNGESWSASSQHAIKRGQKLKVMSVKGLHIIVEPM